LLSGADLICANLSEADLNRARVKDTIFTNTFGGSDRDRIDLEKHGAIFGDRLPVTVGAE
jgi:uncharacterized protein YjbI with pentapeptide repeats